MTTDSVPANLASRLDAVDLSVLIALRTLVERAADREWTEAEELLQGMQESYERLAAEGRTGTGASPVLGEVSSFPGEHTLQYLDEHVLLRMAAEEMVDREAHDGAAEAAPRVRVRLSAPLLREAREGDGRLLAELDERIDASLAAAHSDTHGSPAPGHDPGAARPLPGGETLAARGLVKVYRKRRVVNDVEIELTEGEIVGLLGPNGAGKTTTFYMLVGLIEPDEGKVFLGSENITNVPMFKRARRGIGYLSQEPSVFRKLTVEQNILAILQMRGISKREQRERLEELLDELGIKHLRSAKAYALSGGERRRLEITRALVGEPKFMLLDEPFAGVDPIAVHDIQQIVADLRRRGIGVLISDHNVEQTLDIVDRAYIMYDGRVRVSGTVSELVWNDEVAEIYLGPTLTARMRQRYTNPA